MNDGITSLKRPTDAPHLFIGPDLFGELRKLHEVRRVKHVWEDELAALEDHHVVSQYADPEAEGGVELRVHTKQIFHDVLGKPDTWTASDAENKKLAEIMKRLGWDKPKNAAGADKTFRVRGRKNPAAGYVKRIALLTQSEGN